MAEEEFRVVVHVDVRGKKVPKVLDLFSGAGGISLGLYKSGFKIAVAIDSDHYSLETFKRNFPRSLVLKKDLFSYSPKKLMKEYGFKKGDFDVIVGGPPCQGFSLAGPRNFHDVRNKLYLEFIEYVKFFCPKVFVVENVPGLMGLFKGQIKDLIIQEFSKLGYNVNYKVLLASDYGVPQDRKRIFFIGCRNGKFKFPKPSYTQKNTTQKTLLEKNSKVTVWDAISDLPLLENEGGEEQAEYTKHPTTKYQKSMRKDSSKLHNHVAAKHHDRTKEIIALVPEGCNYKSLPNHLKDTRKFNVAWTRIHSQKPSPTVDTGHRHHFHPKTNRVPTVRECARFQSFPDTFVFMGPKTSQYKQVGNAVPPLLIEHLGKLILKKV